ncbi:MAG: hypothetical protein ACRDZW_04000 [Acidimicrobiales bacterium]
MNRYGRMAYDHTSQHRPRAFASMTDPVGHFTRLGEEIESRISELRGQLLGTIGTTESLEDYRQRSYQARRQAEEMVLAEMVWTDPEPTREDEDDQEILDSRSQLGLISETLVSAARNWSDEPVEPPRP